MFKRITTTVKAAIQNKQTDDDPDNRTNLNTIRDRITVEKDIDRKNQRLKLINEHRINNLNKANDSTAQASTLTKAKSELSLNYSSSDNSSLDRKKRLEQWKKERSSKTSLKDQKPVFKVQHVPPKMFDSKSMSDLRSSKNSSILDSSKAFKFNDSIKQTSYSDSHNLSRQNSKKGLNDNEKYHFGNVNISKFVPQFTFSIKLNALESNHKETITHKAPPVTTATKPALRKQTSSSKIEVISLEKSKKTSGSNVDIYQAQKNEKSTDNRQHLSRKDSKIESNAPVTRSKIAEMKTRLNDPKKNISQLTRSNSLNCSSNYARPTIASTKSTQIEPLVNVNKAKSALKANKVEQVIKVQTKVTVDSNKLKQTELKPVEKKLKTPQANVCPIDLIKSDDPITIVKKQEANVENLELSFEEMNSNSQKLNQRPQDDYNMRSIKREYISTPKNIAHKEELANEFKKMNLSVKKTIKHFETLSNSLNSSLTTENDLSVKHFRSLVESKTKQLLGLSDQWTLICNEQVESIPDNIQGDIRSACGLAKLLIDERFKQFSELIGQCEDISRKIIDPDAKEVKCTDLQGFWEMINHQVLDVEAQFMKLDKIKQNNYCDIEIEPVQRVKKTAVRKAPKLVKAASIDSGTNENAKSNKSKFSEFRAQLKKSKVPGENSTQEDNVEPTADRNEPVSEPEPVVVEKALKSKKRSVVKSRPSDLIKFDSPVPVKKNFNEIIEEEESTEQKENINQFDAENDPFDFESFVPITWKANDAVKNKIFSPKTPTRLNCSDRKTQFSELVNSPLLKLAIVSSHGKTRSAKKSYFA